jgi:hypothetical protein
MDVGGGPFGPAPMMDTAGIRKTTHATATRCWEDSMACKSRILGIDIDIDIDIVGARAIILATTRTYCCECGRSLRPEPIIRIAHGSTKYCVLGWWKAAFLDQGTFDILYEYSTAL